MSGAAYDANSRRAAPCLAVRHGAAEEQLADARIVEHLVGLVDQAGLAEFEHDAEIGNLQRRAGVLLDHQDRDAAVAQFLQDVEGLQHHQRRQADRGLVDQHQLRIEQQAAGDFELLLLAARQRRGLLRGLLAQHRKFVERGFDPRRQVGDVAAGGDRAELDIVAHRQFRKDVAALRHVADAGGQQFALAQAGDVASLEDDLAFAQFQQAEDRLEHGGFAGAVRPDHGGDRSRRHREGGAVEDRHLAVAADQAFEHPGSRRSSVSSPTQCPR